MSEAMREITERVLAGELDQYPTMQRHTMQRHTRVTIDRIWVSREGEQSP